MPRKLFNYYLKRRRPKKRIVYTTGAHRMSANQRFTTSSRGTVRRSPALFHRSAGRNQSSAFGAPSIGIQTGRLPFANMGYYRLPYTESFAISASGTTGLSSLGYTYRMTSPYDPRVETGGAQPMQFDLISPAFERYWVRGAKFTITFSNPLYDGALVGFRVRASTNSTVSTSGRTIAELKELDLTRSRWIHNTGNQTTVFKGFIHPWDIIGITKAQYNNLEYSSAMNNNPSVGVIIEPFLLHSVAGEDNTIRCTVSIKYYLQMTNRFSFLDA